MSLYIQGEVESSLMFSRATHSQIIEIYDYEFYTRKYLERL